MARGRKKGNTGKRYSEEQKSEILAFVASQGRGGITAAGKKYGVSYIALRRWMNGAGGNRKSTRGSSKALDGRKLKSVSAALTALKSFKKQVTILQRALKQLAR